MTKDELIEGLREAAADPETPIEVARLLIQAETALNPPCVTFLGAPVIEGEAEGPTLRSILISMGIPEDTLGFLNTPIKGYQIQSARSFREDVARATRVYRFEPFEPPLEVRFFDCFEEAQEFATTLRYSLIGFDPETDKWSVDELGGNYGC